MKPLKLRDVIGPIMVGPSSSHTAGALRIASMVRDLLQCKPVKADFTLLRVVCADGTRTRHG